VRSKSERHDLAREQATRWAYAAADTGEYLEAIAWLRAIEVIEGTLPHTLVSLRSRCVSAFGVQMEQSTDPKIPRGRGRERAVSEIASSEPGKLGSAQ
jgi:hypothetical protein